MLVEYHLHFIFLGRCKLRISLSMQQVKNQHLLTSFSSLGVLHWEVDMCFSLQCKKKSGAFAALVLHKTRA